MNRIIHVNDVPIPERLEKGGKCHFHYLVIALVIFSLQVSAAAFSQITLHVKNAPLAEVMQKISKQSGYSFSLPPTSVAVSNLVTVNLKDVSVETSLQQVFINQPFDYRIEGKSIIIVLKKSITPVASNRPLERDIHGVVTDSLGRPVPNATVLIKGEKNKMTSTNDKGEFHITNAPDNGIILVRSIGYGTIEQAYNANTIKNLTIHLQQINSELEAVQIIAYGKVEKKYATSNINGITAKQIAAQPVNDPLLALAGRVPGLFIQQTSGVPGSEIEVTVQGNNSMANGNEPFYVVNGIPYPSRTIGDLTGTATPYGGSNFSYINPADIESITILKDADATAIYGSRAANGAILITTKQGKAGKTVVDIRSQTGWGKITRRLNLMNSAQYVEMRKEAFKSAGMTPGDADYDINGVWDQTRNTDWQDVLVGGTAKFTDIQTSVSGGNTNTQFRAGGGYSRQTTVYPGDLDDKKVSLNFNVNHTSTNQRFRFTLSGSYLQDENRLYTVDLMGAAVTLAPNAPALYNIDGTLNWGQIGNSTTYTFDNPLAGTFKKYNGKTYNLLSNALVGYEILPGLELKSTFGYNRITTEEKNINPQTSFRPDKTYLKRSSNFANGYIASYIIEPQLTYNKQLFGGKLEALLGGTIQDNGNARKSFNTTGYTTDRQMENELNATKITLAINTQSTYRYSALFGRINYRFKDRYVLNLTARRDGSSRFGSENLFNSFYSVGGAWLFNQEKFVRKLIPVLSTGKLRVTYGTTGNDQIGDYGYLNLYDTYYADIPYQGIKGLSANGFYNPYLQWEETRKINLGVDLGFFNDGITLTTNYFRNRSSNQLLNAPVPGYTGFGTFRKNLPATLQNTGWEFLLTVNPFKKSDFRWTSSVNLTIPRNKLVAYPGLAESSDANRFVIGQPANIIKAFHYLGVDPQTGLFTFMGADGKATSNPGDPTDKTSLVNLNPKFYGGFYNSFDYKGISLDVLFQFVRQKGLNYRYGDYPGIVIMNQPATIQNHWRTQGDQAFYQKISTDLDNVGNGISAISQSDAAYSDASYIRLKNISLSYTLPGAWMQKAHISQARFFAQGQNLLTFTNYYGSDPESLVTAGLPPLKMYTIGLQLTL
jgi:TonB-linked SusC/RagA family outer membrane protein